MAMNATLDSSKANRRFIILAVVLGLLGAVLVYVAFSRDTSSGGNVAGGASTAVVVAKVDIAARTKVTGDMLEVKLIPQDAVSEFTFADPAQVIGQVTRFPITANQQVLSSQVISTAGTAGTSRALSYTIPSGKRAFAVQTSQLAGAGGLILPGDYIDVLVVYNVHDGKVEEDNFLVQTLLQNIEVLAVSQTIVDTVGGDAAGSTNGQRTRNSEAKPDPGASTYTLLLDPDQVQKMYLAEANGQIRFALRSFGDGTEKPIEFLTELDLVPDTLP
jgi:pilus assembly protein CpaB